MTTKQGITFSLPVQLTFAQRHPTAANQAKSGTKLDAVVQWLGADFIRQKGRMGLSIGIFQDGKTYFYNVGSTQKGKNLLPTQHTIYEIGSISKTFTSFLLAQAVAERKVNLTDDIRTYLDGTYDNLVYAGKPIQLAHLSNTASGLPDNLPDQSKERQQANPDSIPFILVKKLNHYTKQDFLADLHQVKLDTAPGLTDNAAEFTTLLNQIWSNPNVSA